MLPDLLEVKRCQQSDLRPPVLGGESPKVDARALKALEEWAPPKPGKWCASCELRLLRLERGAAWPNYG